MTSPGKKKNGFTLIEMTIVLFLGTLLLGLTTLFFAQTLASGRLTATARELSATIRQARSLARVSDTRQVLTFDLDGREYGLSGHPSKKVPAQLVLKSWILTRGRSTPENIRWWWRVIGGLRGGPSICPLRNEPLRSNWTPSSGPW